MRALRSALLAALLAPGAALATAGYFQLGYGIKAKGMGGVAVALPQDALAAAANPAGMVWVGSRWDAGLEAFEADRGSEIRGNVLGLSGHRDANGRKRFPVPDFGWNRMLGEGRSVGVSVYGNGGTTRYADNPLASLGGSSPAGMELYQGIVAPSFAVKLGERHSVGVALNLVLQRFVARGIEHFDDPIFSQAPGSVTNRGHDRAAGLGVRLGWLGRVTGRTTLGASWQPKIRMQRFERYRGLLAEGGRFDVPENFAIGAAVKATPELTLAADLQRILFSTVPSLGRSSGCFLDETCLLGAADGAGSGWRNTTVLKLGVSWEAMPGLTLRGGVALLRSPIRPSDTLLAVFAPAVSEKHLTLGATWRLAPGRELSFSYQHAFPNAVQGSNSVPPGFPPGGVGGGEAAVRMKQRGFGVALGWAL